MADGNVSKTEVFSTTETAREDLAMRVSNGSLEQNIGMDLIRGFQVALKHEMDSIEHPHAGVRDELAEEHMENVIDNNEGEADALLATIHTQVEGVLEGEETEILSSENLRVLMQLSAEERKHVLDEAYRFAQEKLVELQRAVVQKSSLAILGEWSKNQTATASASEERRLAS